MTISEYQFFGYGTAPGQEESMSTIFRCTHGKVIKHAGGAFELPITNSYAMTIEMAKEIERLRTELAAAQKLAEVGKAIERAQRELPAGREVEIVVNDLGVSVCVLLNAIGDYYESDGETIAEQINDAVERAKEVE